MKRYKSVPSLVKDISSKRFYKHFVDSQKVASKMCKLRQAVIDQAKKYKRLENNALMIAVDNLEVFEVKCEECKR